MPDCKLCGEPVTAGVVIHKDCLTELLKKVRNDVCNYRCKWAMICQDKKNLAERHCCVCEMSNLADLLKEHDEGIVLKKHDSEGNLEQTLRISADRLTLENVSGEKLTIYQGNALEDLADMLGRR